MKKKKVKVVKPENRNSNSSPVCYADNKDLRPEYKEDPKKPDGSK